MAKGEMISGDFVIPESLKITKTKIIIMSLGSKAFHERKFYLGNVSILERNKTSLNSFNNADAARLWTPDLE